MATRQPSEHDSIPVFPPAMNHAVRMESHSELSKKTITATANAPVISASQKEEEDPERWDGMS